MVPNRGMISIKNNVKTSEIRFPMEPAPSECKKKWKIASNVEISTKKVKNSTFSIIEPPKKLFRTRKNFWECKTLVYNCFYVRNFDIRHIFEYRPIFRPDRPIGRYICFTPSHCNMGLQKRSEVVEECLGFHLVGSPASYLTYNVIYGHLNIQKMVFL